MCKIFRIAKVTVYIVAQLLAKVIAVIEKHRTIKKIVFLFVCLLFVMCESPKKVEKEQHFFAPKNRPLDSLKMALGRRLFFDTRLSDTGTISCASCHNPNLSFSDNRSKSVGIFGRLGKRNAQPIVNPAFQRHFFFDGRAISLEEQTLGPLNDSLEMGNSLAVVPKLSQDSLLVAEFNRLFKNGLTLQNVSSALAEYERSITSFNSPFDRFISGDSTAISNDAKAGFAIFRGKGNCADCHSGWNLTDNKFHNIAFFEKKNPRSDKGRFDVTKNEADLGKFKTPTLRNVALTAPYFANGQTATLKAVIELYNKPNPMGFGQLKDPLIKPIHLSEEEKFQLLQFLISLTDTESLLAHGASQAFMDSVINRQNETRQQFELRFYLTEFHQRINYFKTVYADEFKKLPFAQITHPTDIEKVTFCKDVLMGSFRSVFDSGEHVLFNAKQKAALQ